MDSLEADFSKEMMKFKKLLNESIEGKKKSRAEFCIETFKFLQQVLKADSITGLTFLSLSHIDNVN